MMLCFQDEKLRTSKFFFFFFLFIKKKNEMMKNVVYKNLFAYHYQIKKSNEIFLLENYVWISISLTKEKQSIKTCK